MKIALFGTNFSENFNKYIQHLINKLESEKVDIYIEQFFLNYLKEKMRFKNETALCATEYACFRFGTSVFETWVFRLWTCIFGFENYMFPRRNVFESSNIIEHVQ